MTSQTPHPVLYAIATALAFGLVLAVLARADPVTSPIVHLVRADWRCSSDHEEKRQIVRADGGVEFRADVVCDQWVRR